MKKKFCLLLLFILLSCLNVLAEDSYTVFKQGKKLGLKNEQGEVTVKPVYSRLIKLGDNSWIVMKRGRYGLIKSNGEIILPLKYITAERVSGKYIKVFDNYRTGLYDENGEAVIPPIYTKIDVLKNDLFRIYKNYKYGIIDINGNVIISRVFDDIFMSDINTFHARYKGNWYQIKIKRTDNQEPQGIETLTYNDQELNLENIAINVGTVPLYSIVTVADYGLKPLTTFIPAWSDTVDNLFLNKGVDAVSTLYSGIWIPMMPYYYMKSYMQNLFRPEKGPLNHPRRTVKKFIR